LEGGEVSLTESLLSRLGFKLSHIQLVGLAELQTECYSGIALFDHWLPNESFRVANKFIRRKGK
jgi:hypothetical protein